MADYTANAPHHKTHRQERLEYRLYLAIVFVCALPFALAAYAWHMLRHGDQPQTGPLRRARAEAHAIVPMIFRG